MPSRSTRAIAYVSRVAEKEPTPEDVRRGARLKAWRELRGYARQEDFAAAAGISQAQVSVYEKGKRWMHGDTIAKVLATLRITPDQLTGDGPLEDVEPGPESEAREMDPKARVRQSWRYEDAPQPVRDAWERWDKLTHVRDTAKLTEEFYDDLLKSMRAQFDAGVLPDPNPPMEGATVQPELHDPDAPKR